MLERLNISTPIGGVILAIGLILASATVARAVLKKSNDQQDAREIVSTDKLGAELKLDHEERDRLKADNELASDRVKDLEHRLGSISGGSIVSAAQLHSNLDLIQTALVVVVPCTGSAGTGFLYRMEDNNTSVITALPKSAQRTPIMIQFHTDPDKPTKQNLVSLPATIAFADPETGICILKAGLVDATAKIQPVVPERLKSCTSGDRVFATCAQLQPDGSITKPVFDGNISSANRVFGSHLFLQVAIGLEQCMCGAPLVNSSGELVGMMAPQLDVIERTQFAYRTLDLSGPLQSTRTMPDRLTAGSPKNGGSQPTVVAIPRPTPTVQPTPMPKAPPPTDTPPPYAIAEAIKYEFDASHADVEPRLFAGPDNLLIVWDGIRYSLSAYRIGSTTPEWRETTITPRMCIQLLNANDRVLLIDSGGQTRQGMEYDLRSGKSVRDNLKFPSIQSNTTGYRLGEYYLMADLPDCIVDPIAGTQLLSGIGKILFVRGVELYEMNGGQVRHYDYVQHLIHVKAAAEGSKQLYDQRIKDADQRKRIIENYNAANKANAADFHVSPIVISNFDATKPLFRIANSDCVALDRHVIELSGNSLKLKGELNFNAPSDPNDPNSTKLQRESIIAVSPDGKYAVTPSYVFSLSTFERVANLPISTRAGVFTSDGTLFYSYDKGRHLIYSIKTENLIQGKH